MKKIFNRKSFMCLVLSMVMLMGMSTTSLAASGSTYGYSNLNLTWTTSANSASATLRSGTKARLTIRIDGQSLNGRTLWSWENSKTVDNGINVSVSTSRKYSNITPDSYVRGYRNYSQTVFSYIYY